MRALLAHPFLGCEHCWFVPFKCEPSVRLLFVCETFLSTLRVQTHLSSANLWFIHFSGANPSFGCEPIFRLRTFGSSTLDMRVLRGNLSGFNPLSSYFSSLSVLFLSLLFFKNFFRYFTNIFRTFGESIFILICFENFSARFDDSFSASFGIL